MNDIRDKWPAKIICDPNSGCWLWVGRCTKLGYGNIAFYYRTGLKSRKAHRVSWEIANGENHAHAKITNEQALRVRELLMTGERSREVAELLGISYDIVCSISSGKIWKHLGPMPKSRNTRTTKRPRLIEIERNHR